MSVILDAMVVIGLDRYPRTMEAVNAKLRIADVERNQEFGLLDDRGAGGSKVFTTEVWAGAFNHLVPEVVRRAVAEAEWPWPEEILYLETGGDYELPLVAVTVAELRRLTEGDEWHVNLANGRQ